MTQLNDIAKRAIEKLETEPIPGRLVMDVMCDENNNLLVSDCCGCTDIEIHPMDHEESHEVCGKCGKECDTMRWGDYKEMIEQRRSDGRKNI